MQRFIQGNDKDYSLVKYIHARIRNNKNFLATITGPTGSGKSWSSLSIAELIDPNFNVNQVIFRARDLMRLINSGELKAGSVIIWDEAGIDLSSRNWQSVTNKMLNSLLQTFRHKNFILLFTVPYHDFIDSSSRKLFHADFETQRLDKENNKVIIKPKLLQYNSNMSKWYRKYLKVVVNGTVIKIKRWAVPKPSDKLIKEYEAKKNLFTKDLNIDIENELRKLEPEEKESYKETKGVPITCIVCGHTWAYKGGSALVQCSQCMKKQRNPYIEVPVRIIKTTPQLN